MKLRLLKLSLLGLISGLSLPARAYLPAGDDFLCDQPQDESFYNFHRWFASELPLKVYVPPLKASAELQARYPRLLMHAFTLWGQAMPEARFQFVARPEDAALSVRWTEALPDVESAWASELYPQPLLGAQPLHHRAVLQLGLRYSSLSDAKGFLTDADFLAQALHMLGHSLGLTHALDVGDVMSDHLLARLAAGGPQTLSARDVATLRRLYTLPVRLEAPPCNGLR